jgi:KTSC domain
VASETVNVKYRGPVNLATFKCDTIARSSFIQRVCYDEKNAYMLINLSGAWYHYCEIGQGMVSSLLAAESMGRFYNVSIKGNFDCRTHHVPATKGLSQNNHITRLVASGLWCSSTHRGTKRV